MSYPANQQAYSANGGATPVTQPHIDVRDPNATDINWPIGQQWENQPAARIWRLNNFAVASQQMQANWIQIAPTTGVLTLTGSTNAVPVNPDGSGNINLVAGTNITINGGVPGVNDLMISATGGGGGSITIDGDSGSVTGSTIDVYANSGSANCGSSVSFTAASATELDLIVTDSSSNTIIGFGAGNPSITGNAVGCTGFGAGALGTLIGGTSNVAIGVASLYELQNGRNNIATGNNAGLQYNSNESSNIVISNLGTPGDFNTIRIGTQGSGNGQQDTCYIAGITGVTTANSNYVTVDTTTGQLGAEAVSPGGITTINGDSGSITGSTVSLFANTGGYANCGSSVAFTSSSATELDLNVTDSSQNTNIGSGAGLAMTGSNNTVLGNGAGGNAANGSFCVAIGASAFIGSGDNNTFAGAGSGGSITTGANSVGIGQDCLTGSDCSNVIAIGSEALSQGCSDYNIAIGVNVGANYSSTEASNILINNNGIASENNAIHIGTQGSGNGQQNTCFIAGITGVSTSNSNYVTIDTTSGQLGATSASPVVGFTSINRQVFTYTGSPQTYTPTSGMAYCDVEIIGGGGGGGGVDSSSFSGAAGGGGAGGYAKGVFSAADIGASKTVIVGAAGAASSAGNFPGGTGGTSSVNTSSVIQATGGTGGTAATAAYDGIGGSGGVGSGGDFNTTGSTGSFGVTILGTNPYVTSGNGGSSFFGGNALSVTANNLTSPRFNGNPGTSYGGGGSGGVAFNGQASTAGGAGFEGICIITEYIS